MISQHKPTILIVDDEQGTLRSLEMILRDSYRICTAESGREAVEFIRQLPVDMILTDIHMPDMTGIEVLKYSKDLDPTREVVMVTGYANLETAKAALRLGALDYLHKPFEASHILNVVKNGLAKRCKAREALNRLKNLDQQNQHLETELLKSEEKAEMGELTCGVVHDMNNPLTVIQGYVHILLNKLNKNGKLSEEESKVYRQYLENVEKQIFQCRDIAHEFLNFARGGEMEVRHLNLKLMIEELIGIYKRNSIARYVDIELIAEEGIPEIKLNIGLIRQVFVNMIVNAMHAMDSKGKLRIRIRHEEGGVLVEFEDNGKGIPPENLDKIFQTFFTTKEGGKGSGLGLAISKKIVERHGGRISVKSDVGKGTTFAIFFPSQPLESLLHQKTA